MKFPWLTIAELARGEVNVYFPLMSTQNLFNRFRHLILQALYNSVQSIFRRLGTKTRMKCLRADVQGQLPVGIDPEDSSANRWQ